MMTKPLNIVLVTCGSRGDRLLFRYPYEFVNQRADNQSMPGTGRDVYAAVGNQSCQVRSPQVELSEYPDDVLAGLLTPKVAMCGQKFQLTVDNVTFVGYPSFARRVASQDSSHLCKDDSAKSLFQFNVVFALPVSFHM
jgi:hypothetical protein